MIIRVSRCLLTSHVITLSSSCSVADCGYLIRPSCMIHYFSWFYFVYPLCWLTVHRDFLASSGPSYCMTSFWVFLLQQTGQQLPGPYRSPLCIWVRDKEKGLSKVRGEKTDTIWQWLRLWWQAEISYVMCLMCICVFVVSVRTEHLVMVVLFW